MVINKNDDQKAFFKIAGFDAFADVKNVGSGVYHKKDVPDMFSISRPVILGMFDLKFDNNDIALFDSLWLQRYFETEQMKKMWNTLIYELSDTISEEVKDVFNHEQIDNHQTIRKSILLADNVPPGIQLFYSLLKKAKNVRELVWILGQNIVSVKKLMEKTFYDIQVGFNKDVLLEVQAKVLVNLNLDFDQKSADLESVISFYGKMKEIFYEYYKTLSESAGTIPVPIKEYNVIDFTIKDPSINAQIFTEEMFNLLRDIDKNSSFVEPFSEKSILELEDYTCVYTQGLFNDFGEYSLILPYQVPILVALAKKVFNRIEQEILVLGDEVVAISEKISQAHTQQDEYKNIYKLTDSDKESLFALCLRNKTLHMFLPKVTSPQFSFNLQTVFKLASLCTADLDDNILVKTEVSTLIDQPSNCNKILAIAIPTPLYNMLIGVGSKPKAQSTNLNIFLNINKRDWDSNNIYSEEITYEFNPTIFVDKKGFSDEKVFSKFVLDSKANFSTKASEIVNLDNTSVSDPFVNIEKTSYALKKYVEIMYGVVFDENMFVAVKNCVAGLKDDSKRINYVFGSDIEIDNAVDILYGFVKNDYSNASGSLKSSGKTVDKMLIKRILYALVNASANLTPYSYSVGDIFKLEEVTYPFPFVKILFVPISSQSDIVEYNVSISAEDVNIGNINLWEIPSDSESPSTTSFGLSDTTKNIINIIKNIKQIQDSFGKEVLKDIKKMMTDMENAVPSAAKIPGSTFKDKIKNIINMANTVKNVDETYGAEILADIQQIMADMENSVPGMAQIPGATPKDKLEAIIEMVESAELVESSSGAGVLKDIKIIVDDVKMAGANTMQTPPKPPKF